MSKQLRTNVLGFPRIGEHRELKKACEAFWEGKISEAELQQTAKELRKKTWQRLAEAGIDLIPSNDFSLYDQVLDLSITLGVIPERYNALRNNSIQLYFALARGLQKDGNDVTALEMTKWFDTNYHYLVPEFVKQQQFSLQSTKAVDEFNEAKALGIVTKPVLIGPVTYLLIGKEKEPGFQRIDLLDRLLPVYAELLKLLEDAGAEWVQIDEPFLALDIDDKTKEAYRKAYAHIAEVSKLKIILTTYFDGLKDNTDLALSLPTAGLHIDLKRSPKQLDDVLNRLPADKVLSIGVIDGRNIWKANYDETLKVISRVTEKIGAERTIIAGSSSFLHVPYDLELETNENILNPEIKQWLSFAWQKVDELTTLQAIASGNGDEKKLEANRQANANRRSSTLIHDEAVKRRTAAVTAADTERPLPFEKRIERQKAALNLPLFPTTTIGSFPQTAEVRSWRAKFKKGELSKAEYDKLLRDETAKAIRWQEKVGLDVLVHGEFERNDMVEYFGQQLNGFAFTQNGWVQSYGSRCVKPPVIFGDVSRPRPMTVDWAVYAQSLTDRPVKGMLTGPVTILEWSFVRDDQSRFDTCRQIALAIRDEVNDLERAGIKIIQIDEAAFREGLPLRRAEWTGYLNEAVRDFRIASSGVSDDTQIHTHMCYSEFNDIIEYIAAMDADAITIECSRSQMELLNVFRDFNYTHEIGPGVYDIHSARIPSKEEIVDLLQKALHSIKPECLWVNPDCGLKTRKWEETKPAIEKLVEATKQLRREYGK